MNQNKKYIGYCPLTRESVPFAVMEDHAVICYLGGAPGQTCEHMIVFPESLLSEFEKMNEKELSEWYQCVIYDESEFNR